MINVNETRRSFQILLSCLKLEELIFHFFTIDKTYLKLSYCLFVYLIYFAFKVKFI